MTAAVPCWRRMRAADLPLVEAIAAEVHRDYPERPAVFAERLALAPAFCRVLRPPSAEGALLLLGYAVTHPWAAEAGPPPLDSLLDALPARPDAWHIHDVALLPTARGSGHAARLLAGLEARAARDGIGLATLVAVAGKSGYWSRRGFRLAPAAGPGLASYGAGAVFMSRALAPPPPLRGRRAAAAA
jgi:ribosomal protein S18 acetylase RimI-like enzyme